MSIYQPTWLYIKQHNQTGLKYFGKTITDPFTYSGSGKYWRLHLAKHGKDVSTLWGQLFYDPVQLTDYALKFSFENRIVDARDGNGKKIWANLKPENGFDGWLPNTKWFNNGEINILTFLPPNDEWVAGRLYNASHNSGSKWYHRGVDQLLSKVCPGPDWIVGRSPSRIRSGFTMPEKTAEQRANMSAAQRKNAVKRHLTHKEHGEFYGSFCELLEKYPDQKLLMCELWKMSAGVNYKTNGYKGWQVSE